MLMENKNTIELLELLDKAPEEGEKGYDAYWGADGTYEQIMEELKTRPPFQEILGEDWENSLPNLVNQVEELKDEIKLLKRHKHEQKSGDVMIRI